MIGNRAEKDKVQLAPFNIDTKYRMFYVIELMVSRQLQRTDGCSCKSSCSAPTPMESNTEGNNSYVIYSIMIHLC